MPSRINIGPGGGPFVELDEENGELVIRVPEDEVNFDQSNLRNVKDFTAGSVSTEDPRTTYKDQWRINVPSDYATVKAALFDAASLRHVSKALEGSKPPIEINIEAGHEISEPIETWGCRLNHIRIVSEDPEVRLADSFPDDGSFLTIRNSAIGPRLELLIDANGKCTDACISVQARSSIHLDTGSGVKNAAGSGLAAWHVCHIAAHNTIWQGNMGGQAVILDEVCRGNFEGAEFTNNGDKGFEARNQCSVNMDNASVIDNAGRGINLTGQVVASCEGSTISGNTINLNGAEIFLRNSVVDSGGGLDMAGENGSILRMEGCETSSSTGSEPHQDDINMDFNDLTGKGIAFAENFETA